MRLITSRTDVLNRLQRSREASTPLLCPNAETPDEMEGILLGAERWAAASGLPVITVGIGFTASYPLHPQLERIALAGFDTRDNLETTAQRWLGWLSTYADKPALFARVEVIPFLDHGWAPLAADVSLMQEAWFQSALGIIMYDASLYSLDENIARTRQYVEQARSRVVVEACPDKVYERAELEARQLDHDAMLSRPEEIARFVKETGVDLVVPNLGTEHRALSQRPLHYRSDLAREITGRVGAIQALHGTSSLGRSIARVGYDGICKVNYYTGMTQAASRALREAWQAGPEPLAIGAACGSFIHQTRRTAVAHEVAAMLQCLYGVNP